MFNRNFPKWGILLWCFALGLCVDIFSNTPGVAAAAMTLTAAIQPYVLNLFTQRDTAGSTALTTAMIIALENLRRD